jgi:hypothetical protein
MVFLTPLFLFGLLAALIPIAIHLIRKEKPPKLLFSTIRFMKKTSKKLVLFQQLQQLFLLMLRAGVLALLVLAFARPLFDQTLARLVDSDPQSAVILLDVSMSMRYGNTFELAKEAALDLLDTMTSGDEVALVAFSGSAEFVNELDTDIESIRSRINGIVEPGNQSTRYMPNLRLADQLLEDSRYENRAVYLISDFQAIGDDDVRDNWKFAPGVAFTGIDVGNERSENLSITDVRSPDQLLEDNSVQEILARVRSTGNAYLDRGEVSLVLNGDVIDRRSIDLANKSEEVISFTANFADTGSYVGEIRVSGDSFSPDNSYYFTVDVLPKINVLVVNGEASENWFDDEGHWFSLAVSGTAQSPFELTTVEPEEMTASLLRQNDVAVLLNVGSLSSAQAASLTSFVEEGGSVLFAPGDRVEATTFNSLFADVTPALIQPSTNIDDYLVIADFDRRHPILRPLNTDWSARFQQYWALQAVADAQIIMQFDSTEAAFVERKVGAGRAMIFASSLDLEWNNLALQGLYLPFVHETLRHLVQAESGARAFTVGDSFSVGRPDANQNVSVIDVDGSEYSLNAQDPTVRAEKPGVLVAVNGAMRANYAINVQARESNFGKLPVTNLYDRIINPDTSPIQSREVQTAQMIREIEGPQRIWWWLLCLVAVLIVAEVIIANRTYR